jgi:transcriptional regulator with XRE-family HTH domain
VAGRRVTLADVARRSGVSIATVSYVVNGGNGTISRPTQERVRQAAAELGYRPNTAAGILRRGHANLVLTVIASGPPSTCDWLATTRAVSEELDLGGRPVVMYEFDTHDLLVATVWTIQPWLVVVPIGAPEFLRGELQAAGAREVAERRGLGVLPPAIDSAAGWDA